MIFSSLSHFIVKPVTLYYAKIKSSKSKSAHIFWIGWLINQKSRCLCLGNSVLIYESLRYTTLHYQIEGLHNYYLTVRWLPSLIVQHGSEMICRSSCTLVPQRTIIYLGVCSLFMNSKINARWPADLLKTSHVMSA